MMDARGAPEGHDRQRRMMNVVSASRSRSTRFTPVMISLHSHPLVRRTATALALLGVLAACQKNDASAGQVAGKLDDVTQVAGQKFDQAASYVGQQVDAARATAEQNFSSAASAPSIRIDPADLASTAQANLQNAASATGTALDRAATMTDEGVQSAGHKLQQWSSQSTAASSSASTSTSTSTDSTDAQKQMDK